MSKVRGGGRAQRTTTECERTAATERSARSESGSVDFHRKSAPGPPPSLLPSPCVRLSFLKMASRTALSTTIPFPAASFVATASDRALTNFFCTAFDVPSVLSLRRVILSLGTDPSECCVEIHAVTGATLLVRANQFTQLAELQAFALRVNALVVLDRADDNSIAHGKHGGSPDLRLPDSPPSLPLTSTPPSLVHPQPTASLDAVEPAGDSIGSSPPMSQETLKRPRESGDSEDSNDETGIDGQPKRSKRLRVDEPQSSSLESPSSSSSSPSPSSSSPASSSPLPSSPIRTQSARRLHRPPVRRRLTFSTPLAHDDGFRCVALADLLESTLAAPYPPHDQLKKQQQQQRPTEPPTSPLGFLTNPSRSASEGEPAVGDEGSKFL